jgi:NitT/TauT family transport system substrate-binding protein
MRWWRGCLRRGSTGAAMAEHWVAVPALASARYVFLASMVAYVGLDPRKDLNVVMRPGAESMRRLAEGKIDAYLGFSPEPQELRPKQIGHIVVNSTVDRPWSQYFCCMLVGNRAFVRTHPVATNMSPYEWQRNQWA